MRWYAGDLHIHTVLSPCSEYRMVPSLIVRRALDVGLDFVAIADHNSSGNVAAVIEAGTGSRLRVIPGMEVESREEVHALALFDTVEQAEVWQRIVADHLPLVDNDEDAFGVQCLVSAEDEFLGKVSRLLLTACDLSIGQIGDMVRAIGGLLIPAHVDRPIYSLIASLGFVPSDLDVPALEISRNASLAHIVDQMPAVRGRTIVCNSDAHDLEQIGAARTYFCVEEITIPELALACRGQEGRSVSVLQPF